ncbi:hypothetical protein Ancab_002879 [Ancistrocladus abbreviatus]
MTMAAELIFFPLPGISHLIPMVEIGKRLIKQDDRISVTILIVKLPSDGLVNSYIESLESDSSPTDRRSVKFLQLPELEKPLDHKSRNFVEQLVEDYKPVVKKYIAREELAEPGVVGQLVTGLVVDMFCTGMLDVAEESNVPAYLLYTSAASTLRLLLHFQSLRDDHGIDVTELAGPDAELEIPGFKDRVPSKVLPAVVLDKSKDGGCDAILNHAKRYRETKGIILNTFMEIEPHAIRSLSEDPNIPPVYPMGPIVNLNPRDDGGGSGGSAKDDKASIIRWLDDQPSSSVVFLCFGSMGCFDEEQTREISNGLEQSGHRFLWSLRLPGDGMGLEDLMPDGFLDRTATIGKIIGWAPQVAILSHPAVGGFVSHCGWNSVLESLWFGVPIATWPMYAEQQLNAFRLVKDLGLAVEIRMDHFWDFRTRSSNRLVKAEEIEKGVKKLMDTSDHSLRKNVKEMSEACRKAAMEGGSSYVWSSRFAEDVMANVLKQNSS